MKNKHNHISAFCDSLSLDEIIWSLWGFNHLLFYFYPIIKMVGLSHRDDYSVVIEKFDLEGWMGNSAYI